MRNIIFRVQSYNNHFNLTLPIYNDFWESTEGEHTIIPTSGMTKPRLSKSGLCNKMCFGLPSSFQVRTGASIKII